VAAHGRQVEGAGGPSPPLPSVLRGSELSCHSPGGGSPCKERVPRHGAQGGHHPPRPQLSCRDRDPHPFLRGHKRVGGPPGPPHPTVLGAQKLPCVTEPPTHPALSRLRHPALARSPGPESGPAPAPSPHGLGAIGQPHGGHGDPGYGDRDQPCSIPAPPPSVDTAPQNPSLATLPPSILFPLPFSAMGGGN